MAMNILRLILLTALFAGCEKQIVTKSTPTPTPPPDNCRISSKFKLPGPIRNAERLALTNPGGRLVAAADVDLLALEHAGKRIYQVRSFPALKK